MEEAERYDWLVAMDEGKVLATGSPAELREQTNTETLDDAFIALLPENRQVQESGDTANAAQREPTGGENQTPAIEAEHLTLRFGSFTAVRNVSFSIPKGEIFGFLGSNGCGKTTTMKMLTGLLTPTEGEVRLFGEPLDAKDLATRQKVGYMSQAFSLYGELTVRQNLDLHARLFHLPDTRIPERISVLVREFGLEDVLDQRAGALPLGGVRQRLSLAVAVVHEPELLILDEPTSGVDPGGARNRFWQLLMRLSREDGVTIFISTHFMNEGERCDRISLMHAGEVLACDTPDRLVEASGTDSLEGAFMKTLEAVDKEPETGADQLALEPASHGDRPTVFSPPRRLLLTPPGKRGNCCGIHSHGLRLYRFRVVDADPGLRHYPGCRRPVVRRAGSGPDTPPEPGLHCGGVWLPVFPATTGVAEYPGAGTTHALRRAEPGY